MTTGITAMIRERDYVSLKDFALRSARHIGFLAFMRDEPVDAEIPLKFEPSSYHKDNFRKATQRYYSACVMRNDEAERQANKDYFRQVERHGEVSQKKQQLAVKYGNMLAHVAKWQSPSSDHDGLRNFMIEHLEISLRFDCGYCSETPKKKTASEYRAQIVKEARRDMEYHKKEHFAEVGRARERTGWINVLRESLPLE